MRINLARKKLREGSVISGPSLGYASPEIVEEAVRHGFDFVWIDWQHGAWSEPTMNAALACCVGMDAVPIVRTLGPDPGWIGKLLDLGALGIIVPMVETADQCERIVRAVKFPPRGGRSATGLRTAYHAGGDYFDYTENANEQILTIVMVETPTGIGNVRAMMAVPDIDCVLIGPYDLTRSSGCSEMSDPRVEAMVQEVLAASKETGVPAGYVTNSPEEAEARAAQGFRMVCPGHDMIQLPQAFAEMGRCSARLAELPRAAPRGKGPA
jgi:2-keto-3-deoxy-L-rhamnonate aldolase RhmA